MEKFNINDILEKASAENEKQRSVEYVQSKEPQKTVEDSDFEDAVKASGKVPSEAERLFARGLRGIAIPGHRLHTPLTQWIPMFQRMEQLGMVLDLCLHEDNHQLAEMEEVVKACPDLKIAIGHFGMVTCEGWMEQIRLARHKNVYVESGGITWLFNAEFYPYPSAMQAIRQAADEVGIEKLMWGSDYPRTITAITYRMSYDFVLKSDVLTDREKQLFLGENARQFYGFKELVELPYIKNMSE